MTETTFKQQKQSSLDILLNTRELNTLMDIKLYINNKKSFLEYKEIESDSKEPIDEITYLENTAKLDVYTELEFFIDSKIEQLKQ